MTLARQACGRCRVPGHHWTVFAQKDRQEGQGRLFASPVRRVRTSQFPAMCPVTNVPRVQFRLPMRARSWIVTVTKAMVAVKTVPVRPVPLARSRTRPETPSVVPARRTYVLRASIARSAPLLWTILALRSVVTRQNPQSTSQVVFHSTQTTATTS